MCAALTKLINSLQLYFVESCCVLPYRCLRATDSTNPVCSTRCSQNRFDLDRYYFKFDVNHIPHCSSLQQLEKPVVYGLEQWPYYF